MVNLKDYKRTFYEQFYLNIYIIIPALVLLSYLFIYLLSGFNLCSIRTYNKYKIEISMAVAGISLTVMGLFTSLPNTEIRQLMKKYKHDRIINRTLFLGVLSSITTVILGVIEKLIYIQSILFTIGITETIIASVWLYKTLMHIND